MLLLPLWREICQNRREPPGAKVGTVDALVPIVELRHALREAAKKSQDVKTVSDVLSRIPKQEIAFKQVFDEYSDPVSYKQKFVDQNAFLVYYTKGFDGPNRPSIESDLPEKQTLQFGARNDAWIAWSDLQAELNFAESHPGDENDVSKLVTSTLEAIDAYLKLAPPEDTSTAMRQMKISD